MMVTNTQLSVVVKTKVDLFFFSSRLFQNAAALKRKIINNPEQFQLVIRAGPELENSDHLTLFPP